MSPLRSGSEAAFQQQVEQLAALYGWRWFHAPDNIPRQTHGGRTVKQRVTPGFPNLILVRDGDLIAAELKAEKGRATVDQLEWLHELEAVPGVETYVWRPSDFDEINARLSRGRHRLERAA